MSWSFALCLSFAPVPKSFVLHLILGAQFTIVCTLIRPKNTVFRGKHTKSKSFALIYSNRHSAENNGVTHSCINVSHSSMSLFKILSHFCISNLTFVNRLTDGFKFTDAVLSCSTHPFWTNYLLIVRDLDKLLLVLH